MRRIAAAAFNCYRRSNHVARRDSAALPAPALTHKILCKCGPVKFDETSRRIRVDFSQNPTLIANDSFNAVC
jgi:hypothetical protein